MKSMGVAVRAVCLLALAVGIAWNVRFAAADLAGRRNQPAGTRLAMRLTPENGAYPAQLADAIYASDPEAAKPLLERAVRLNPYDAASWIKLAFLYEAGGDLPHAENALLRAAAVDATFLPSWSLANFYFRHQEPERFWPWAQKAAQMAPEDATALFRLASYISPDAAEIENRLQVKRPVMQRQFVNFLMAQDDPRGVAEAASRLSATNDKANTETVLEACDWLIEHRDSDLAAPLWNGIAASLSYPPLAGDPVTNGSFSKAPLSHGFDWRLMTVDGVSSYLDVHPNMPGALGFEFSGEEPDSFLLLKQTVPVKAARVYVLAIAYNTSGIPPGSGLEWRVSDRQTGAVLARTASLSAEQEGSASVCFAAPMGAPFVDLGLFYQRQPGTVRVEGKLALKGVKLSAAASENCRENPGSKT
jgi:tetratricopeptide (TPR) repeat protein